MFTSLRVKIMLPIIALTLLVAALTAPPLRAALSIAPESWTLTFIFAVGGVLLMWMQSRQLDALHNLRARMQRAPEGGTIGSPPQMLDEEIHDIWSVGHSLQQQVERQRSTRQRQERNLERIATAIELLAQGLDASDKLDLQDDDPAFEAVVEHLGGLNAQLIETRTQIENLKRGEIDTLPLKQKQLEIKRLTEADLPIPRDASRLHEDLLEMQNALRRLTLQTHLIAADRLDSPLLDETIPGELGDAYVAMVEHLRQLDLRARQIADGDLSIDTQHDGSLHASFNAMVGGLRSVVSQITQTAVRISTSAEEILAVLHEQELSASHQASGVEETQRTMETLLSSAKKIAESAQTVFKSAERTQANNRIISDRASELKSHSERIAEILESIKEIADRSDLLALNASLEGLRAGEAGKGFTLVANEMRRLAENVKGSVEDIKDLLGNIRQSALSNIMAIEEGSRLSERTTDSALKITLITQQQQSGTEQVTQSMEELSHLINQGLAGTRQVTTAAGELATLSDDMRGLVDAFNLHEDVPLAGALPQSIGLPHVTPAARQTTSSSEWKSLRTRTGRNQAIATRQTQHTPARGLPSSPRTAPTTITGTPAINTRHETSTSETPGEKQSLEATQLALHTQLPQTRDELNATMRFVGYSDAIQNKDAPTLDVSKMSAELLASDYDDMDSLFHELDASPSPSKPGGISTTPQSLRDTVTNAPSEVDDEDDASGEDKP